MNDAARDTQEDAAPDAQEDTAPDAQEEWPRVTLRHLRADETNCSRRLAFEMHARSDTSKNRSARATFELEQRVEADATNAHVELRCAGPADFRTPRELTAEQQAAYDAAAIGYLALFPDAVRHDPELEVWETASAEHRVRWSGRVGIPCRDASDQAHLRRLLLGSRAPQLDRAWLFFAALRTEGWAEEVVVDVGSLLVADRLDPIMITPAVRDDARRWSAAQVARARDRVAHPMPRMGRDCLGCPCVAGCKAHDG